MKRFAPALLCIPVVALLVACGDASKTEPKLEAIATGASMAGANGVHFGPDGLLYAASVVGSTITVINPDSGEIVKQYGSADGVVGPDDIAFAPDGSFYWTSILTGEVAGFDPAGTKIIAANLAPGVNPITFSDDGRMFVAQCFLGTNLYEVDPKGTEEPRLISDTLGPGCGLNGMDWGPDNRLYGPRWFTGEIVSFDVDDNTMRLEATGFGTPASVKFDSNGVLHVLDTGRGQVVKVEGDRKSVVAELSPGLDNFAFDDKNTIYVSSFADGSITRVNPDGSHTELQPGGIPHSGGVTFYDGKLVMADLHAIRGFDPASGEEVLTQVSIVGVSEMGSAFNVSTDGDNLLLASWFDGEVRQWNPVTSKRGKRIQSLLGPIAAVRYDGQIVVSEHGKHRVVGFSDDGQTTLYASELPAPSGLVVEGYDLYLSDRTLGQILMIASNGEPLSPPLVVADNLTTPEGFVVSTNGFVVFESDTGNIVEVNSAGERNILATVPPGSEALPTQPPSQIFNGIVQADDGTLYFPSESERVLYRLTR